SSVSVSLKSAAPAGPSREPSVDFVGFVPPCCDPLPRLPRSPPLDDPTFFSMLDSRAHPADCSHMNRRTFLTSAAAGIAAARPFDTVAKPIDAQLAAGAAITVDPAPL